MEPWRSCAIDDLVIDTANECWPWEGLIRPNGYGQGWVRGSKHGVSLMHRAVYEIANGAIPAGLVLDHLCRNRACCNPSHLEAVTPGVNNRRGYGIAAENARKEECPKCGAPFTPLIVRGEVKGRQCRPCMRKRNRAKGQYRAVSR